MPAYFYLAVVVYVLALFAWRINWLLKQHSPDQPVDRAPERLGPRGLPAVLVS